MMAYRSGWQRRALHVVALRVVMMRVCMGAIALAATVPGGVVAAPATVASGSA